MQLVAETTLSIAPGRSRRDSTACNPPTGLAATRKSSRRVSRVQVLERALEVVDRPVDVAQLVEPRDGLLAGAGLLLALDEFRALSFHTAGR